MGPMLQAVIEDPHAPEIFQGKEPLRVEGAVCTGMVRVIPRTPESALLVDYWHIQSDRWAAVTLQHKVEKKTLYDVIQILGKP